MNPNLETLDTIIDQYAYLRKSGSCEKAFEAVRFSVHSKVEYFQATEAFDNIFHIAKSYAKLCRMMSRPRCGIELPLALSTICLMIVSIYFAPSALSGQNGLTLTRLLISTNGILLFIYIVRQIAHIWCELRLRAAIYDELAEKACHESGHECIMER